MIRRALLRASQSEWLRLRLPRYRVVRATLSRFMPGETVEAAIDAARRLAGRNIPATFTHLGENVTDLRQAEQATRHYLEVLDRVEERGLDVEVSVKLTHLGLDIDESQTFRHLEQLAEGAARSGNWVWFDMESSLYVDRTLDLYRRLRERYERVGVCVQAYLHRTEEDVAKLLPLDPGIRLVKGAYREPRDIAFSRRRQVDENYFRLAMQVLDGLRSHRVRLALGTHDTDLIARIDEAARAMGLTRDAFEVQMLYGIRAADQYRLAGSGFRVRTLIAYGSYWYPWFMRRLAERPANVLLMLRNLFSGGAWSARERAGRASD